MAEIDRTAARCISMLCVLISPFYECIKIGRSKNENDVLQRHRFSAIIADPYMKKLNFRRPWPRNLNFII